MRKTKSKRPKPRGKALSRGMTVPGSKPLEPRAQVRGSGIMETIDRVSEGMQDAHITSLAERQANPQEPSPEPSFGGQRYSRDYKNPRTLNHVFVPVSQYKHKCNHCPLEISLSHKQSDNPDLIRHQIAVAGPCTFSEWVEARRVPMAVHRDLNLSKLIAETKGDE